MIAVPVALFWTLAIWAMLSRRPVLIYLFFASMPFGAFAVLPPTVTGGLTFTATPIVTVLIILRVLATRQGPSFFLTSALLPRRLLLLFLFWIVAVVTTIFMPRLFAYEVMVVPFRGVLSETSPLRPTTQNVSQLAYMTISVLAVFAFARYLRAPAIQQHALKALCLGGAVTAATGFVDYASQFVPLQPVLAPFRTATYALVTEVEVLGVKRVVGLMPEASAFGGLSLALLSALYFFRRAIGDDRTRDLYAPIVLALLALCCWLSTSSSTYVGLAMLVVVAAAEWLLRAHTISDTGALYRRGLVGELSVVVGLVILLALVILLVPAVLEPVYALIDRMVLQKTASASFEERGMWRAVALASVFETYGFGVGLGSTRASSSLVGIFCSTGLIGGALYYAFVLQMLWRRPPGLLPQAQLILSAFRFSFIPPFMVSLLVGDADFGTLTAFGFGIVMAVVIGPDRIRPAPPHVSGVWSR